MNWVTDELEAVSCSFYRGTSRNFCVGNRKTRKNLNQEENQYAGRDSKGGLPENKFSPFPLLQVSRSVCD